MLGALFTVPVAGTPGTINVDPDESIQDAINAASPGDTILVASGRYHEHNLLINKSLTLRGAGSDTTFIDGDGKNDTIVSIIASNVEVTGFTIENGSGSEEYPYGAIQIMHNVSVTISDNVIRKSYYGVFLSMSNSCDIIRNTIAENYHDGIRLSGSCSNRFIGNNITNNQRDIYLTNEKSRDNVFYHNNLINIDQVTDFGSGTIWDDSYPSGGNYWSDYKGVDEKSGPSQNETGSDGIDDRARARDKYPLMGPICIFNACTWAEKTYYVDVVSNSSISNFYFDRDQGRIKFNVTGPMWTDGFCRVTIPRQLLWVESEERWIVLVDNTSVDYAVKEDDNHTYLYFTYSHSAKTVEIKGTHVVPEFPTPSLLPVFIIATLITMVLIKRRYFPV